MMTPRRPVWLNDDPRHWRPGTLDRAGLNAEAAALARRADFHFLMQRFAACWLQTQADHPELRAVFRNTQRYLLLIASLVLDHRRNPADPASALTARRLLQFFEEVAGPFAPASAGQVKAMLAHARLHELVCPAPMGGDRRQHPLQPTERLHRTMRQWVGGFLRAMTGIDELRLPDHADALLDRPGLVPEMFAYRLAAMQHDRFVLFECQPMLRWVLAHDGGYRVFLNLVRVAEPMPGGGAIVRLSAGELAHRGSVSRGTVRNLMADAAAQDWLETPAPAPVGWRLSARGMAVARHWVALELVWMHGLVCAAWDAGAAFFPSRDDQAPA